MTHFNKMLDDKVCPESVVKSYTGYFRVLPGPVNNDEWQPILFTGENHGCVGLKRS